MEEQEAKAKRVQRFDELCNSQRTANFPLTDPALLDTAEVLPQSFDDFYNDFASMFKTNLNVLQPFEDRLREYESIINQYTTSFFQQESDPFIPMKPVARSFDLTADELDNVDPGSELGIVLKRRRQIMASFSARGNEYDRETVENIRYKPFRIDFYNNRPFSTIVDVLDILNKVTQAQKFKDNFLSCWNKIVRSETNQHILLDAFWWTYLKYFTKPSNVDEECEKYFTRIATNYVELLLSVDGWFRDRFFDIYASYLAQAVYQMFFNICPDSRMNLTDQFKEFLASTITEWVSGTQATPETYKRWKIRADATMLAADSGSGRNSTRVDIMKKIRRLEEDLEAMGDESGEETSRSVVVQTPKRNVSIDFSNKAEIEKELVDLSNQSTLVAWFFQQCDIQPSTPRLRNIERTHIIGWPAGH